MSEALVAVRLAFDAAFTTTIDAVWEAGDAVLPIHPDLPGPEVQALLGALRPGFLVDASGVRQLPGAAPVEPGTALVVPTSGTTGTPKGVVLSHDNLSASALATAARLELGAQDRWLCCVPPSHIAGLMVLVRARLTGSAVVLHPRFDPAAIAAESSTNLVSFVPTMLRRLLAAGVDVARFRWILLAGGPAPSELVSPASVAGARLGRPDDEWGQAVAAVVVPAPGAAPTLAELRAFVAERLAPYKAPRYLVIVTEVPRGPTGKPVGLEALVAGPSAISA